MLSKVYNNVEDQRLYDDQKVVEGVTSVTLPTVTPTNTTINQSGMVADVDVPSNYHVEAMEFSVAHNNGVNCQALNTPGKHSMELRVARQVYSAAKGEMVMEGMKVRVVGLFKSVEKGSLERGNPYGSTVKFSVLRYEELLNGKQVALIDAMTGTLKINGKNFSNAIEKLLN